MWCRKMSSVTENDIAFDFISPHTAANTSGIAKSANFGAISLNDLSIAIDGGRSVEVGELFRKKLENHFNRFR